MSRVAIVMDAWRAYPDSLASRLVAMTTRGIHAADARRYAVRYDAGPTTPAKGQPCKQGQSAALTECIPAKQSAAKSRVREVAEEPAPSDRPQARGSTRVSAGGVVLEMPRLRARKGSSTTPEQRADAGKARESFVTGQLGAARAAFLEGDTETGGAAMMRARVAAEIGNADFWVRTSDGGEIDPEAIDALVGDQGKYLAALATKKEGSDWVDTRFPAPPPPKFPSDDPDVSPYTGQKYKAFRANGQPGVKEIFAGLVQANKVGKEGGQASIKLARKIAGEYKRHAWAAEIQGQEIAHLSKFARRYLDWAAPEARPDDGVPF